MVKAQEWLNKRFPNETEKAKVRTLAVVSYTYNKWFSENWEDHTKWIPVGEEKDQLFFKTENGRSIVVDKIKYDFCLSSLPDIGKLAPDRSQETIDERTGFYEWIGNLIDGSLEVENFPNLEKLIFVEQGITNLKVGKTPKLESLTCAYTLGWGLQELILNCPSLKFLQINHNPTLQKVNFGSLPQLTNFYFEITGCYGNSKEILDKLVQVEKEVSLRLRKIIEEQQISIQSLQTELEREKSKNKFLNEQLEEILQRNEQEQLSASIEFPSQ